MGGTGGAVISVFVTWVRDGMRPGGRRVRVARQGDAGEARWGWMGMTSAINATSDGRATLKSTAAPSTPRPRRNPWTHHAARGQHSGGRQRRDDGRTVAAHHAPHHLHKRLRRRLPGRRCPPSQRGRGAGQSSHGLAGQRTQIRPFPGNIGGRAPPQPAQPGALRAKGGAVENENWALWVRGCV